MKVVWIPFSRKLGAPEMDQGGRSQRPSVGSLGWMGIGPKDRVSKGQEDGQKLEGCVCVSMCVCVCVCQCVDMAG